MPRLSSIDDSTKKPGLTTPSQYPMPVFTLCPPVYAENTIKNNPTMQEHKNKPIDKNKFLAEWYNLYNVLAANALVYLLTPIKGLQDQTYVNSFAYLPHYTKKDTIILSNFTAEGRAGEEEVAGGLLADLGYELHKCPFKFEGDAELKWLRDDIYLGGYGFRTDIRALNWIEETFGAKIIKIKETDEILYHLDCSAFVFNDFTVMLCAEIMDSKTVHEIEKLAAIIPVSRADAYEGICNCIKVEDAIYNSSPLEFMKPTEDNYGLQKHKNETLERICRENGSELIYFDLRECESSGAKCSCFCGTLHFVR